MLPKKILFFILFLATVGMITAAGVFYYYNLRGAWTALAPVSQQTIQEVISSTSTFKLPPGFSMSVFAKDLPGARVLVFDHSGNLWVSQTGQGSVSRLLIQNGKLQSQSVFFGGLVRPHGLAFDPDNPDMLYIAGENEIVKADISLGPGTPLQKVIDLPKGGVHFTRTIVFGADGRLYVSIGSTCNVCRENDVRYASIYSMNKDGSDFKQVAKGLRNSVFFTWNNNDGKIWAADMGRDLLGDNIPPDEINIIDPSATSTADYGWPNCYGKNIHDTQFDKNTYIRNPCLEPFEKPSHIDLQAHSAPLGLVFVSSTLGWPQDYAGNLLVAFHGSWNRSVPTGYKVVRLILDNNGGLVRQEDFITGWLEGNTAIGRPAGLVYDNNGYLYISDDKTGVIYRVEYKNK